MGDSPIPLAAPLTRKDPPMAELHVYNSVSLDGYFTDAQGEMGWAHKADPE